MWRAGNSSGGKLVTQAPSLWLSVEAVARDQPTAKTMLHNNIFNLFHSMKVTECIYMVKEEFRIIDRGVGGGGGKNKLSFYLFLST